jgi:DNA repair protein RadD
MVAFELRPYQRQALDELDAYWAAGGGNPLIVLGTGLGKSLVIAWIIRDVLEKRPDLRIVVATHVQELIDQNLAHLHALWPDAPVGVNCAGLGERDYDHQVLFVLINSVYRNSERLGKRNLLLVDEAHRISHADDGMYKRIITKLRETCPDLRVCGFTATPFRLDTGSLIEGEGKVFDDVIFNYGIGEGIRDKWLSPLVSKTTETKYDVSGVGRRGGEFIESELQAAVDTQSLVAKTCAEIITKGTGRKSCLIFAVGIEHAEHVRDELRRLGETAEMVTGETSQDERKELIDAFKRGTIRFLVNVEVLTTGFNAEAVDLLVMLRPTLSTGLFVQMVGRASRKAEGKQNALILDFAGNTLRHGPVNTIDETNFNFTPSVKPDEKRGRICPNCESINRAGAKVCIDCDQPFEKQVREATHSIVPVAAPVLLTPQDWLAVDKVSYAIHFKRMDPTAAPTLRTDYLVGFTSYSEYLSFEKAGYPRDMAVEWWTVMGGPAPVPMTTKEACNRAFTELDAVIAIRVRRDGQWWKVLERKVERKDGLQVEIDQYYRITVAVPTRLSLAEEMADEVPY